MNKKSYNEKQKLVTEIIPDATSLICNVRGERLFTIFSTITASAYEIHKKQQKFYCWQYFVKHSSSEGMRTISKNKN